MTAPAVAVVGFQALVTKSFILFAAGLSLPPFGLPPGSAPGTVFVPQHENPCLLMKRKMNRKKRIAITGKIHHHPIIGELHQNHITLTSLISS
jgi:hypothetical protein